MESAKPGRNRRGSRSTTQRGLGVVIGVGLITGVVFALVVGVTMFRNDRTFDDWAIRFTENPPPGLTVVDSGGRFGLLVGQGNHCDGEAWVVLQGSSSTPTIVDHYENLAGITVEATGTGRWRVAISDRLGPAGLDPRCH